MIRAGGGVPPSSPSDSNNEGRISPCLPEGGGGGGGGGGPLEGEVGGGEGAL